MSNIKIKKFSKIHRGKNKGCSSSGNLLSFGNFGIKSISQNRITIKQIESGRRVLSKYIKKNGKIWIRIYPDKAITKKPIETRMGGGKGDFSHYVFIVKPGRIIYEISGVLESLAINILKLASYKLPLKTIFVKF